MKRKTQKKRLNVNKITICMLNNAEMITAQAGGPCPPPTIYPFGFCVTENTCPDTTATGKTM